MPPPPKTQQVDRVLIFEPDKHLASEIVSALEVTVPHAQLEIARSLEEAQHLVLDAKPDLFVLDVDATYDLGQEFLNDLRASHPNARAIVLTAIHLAARREQAKGLGVIHFLEKPFPRQDFVDLVQGLLHPSSKPESERFQRTLSDLHIADIIQLKCMSGATSTLEFTGPRGEKARVFFENGQVRHATAPRKEGVAAFNEIVNWRKYGKISEVSDAGRSPRTIDLDWQSLIMDAVRKIDEPRSDAAGGVSSAGNATDGRKILVIDDSLMLLSFVNEILTEANYHVASAAMGKEGLRASTAEAPDLILLDYVLPDMQGDEVSRRLLDNPATKNIPVLYMSGLGTDLQSKQAQNPNVIGFLNKPFTSETLIRTIEKYIPKSEDEMESARAEAEAPEPSEDAAEPVAAEQAKADSEFTSAVSEEIAASESPPWWGGMPEPETEIEASESLVAGGAEPFEGRPTFDAPGTTWPSVDDSGAAAIMATPDGGAFFSGDTHFFSLHWALQTIAKEKLTGTLRCFWDKETVELLAHHGQIVLVTTRDPNLYCSEAPITLVDLDADKLAHARARQTETGGPIFVTLAREGLIIREPALQLVQHYGQKLFAQLWAAPRVRFVFEQSAQLPDFASGVPAEEDIDQWILNTLRFIQHHELGPAVSYDPESIPAYTRDGFARVQNLRLTVAEAQFASQFNGTRSIQQIAKNLRLDLKFAQLTLFRFLALEIVECWPASSAIKPERRGLLQRFGFGG
ncbi:MAG: response regulator [Verrucomicrobiota bacterium]|nr:response regulator [Verrucomicrobiota bacterium]